MKPRMKQSRIVKGTQSALGVESTCITATTRVCRKVKRRSERSKWKEGRSESVTLADNTFESHGACESCGISARLERKGPE